MKQLTSKGSRLILAMFIIIFAASCGKEKNVVTDFPPVTDALYRGYPLGFPLDSFKRGDSATKQALIDTYRPLLVENARHYLGECITPDSIEFVFGSGRAKKVENATGKPVNGRFENELIIIVKNACKKGAWFLACGNGVLGELTFDDGTRRSYGDGCQIIIQKGESLATYWPMLQRWSSVAKTLRVPIRNVEGKVVTARVYEHVLGKYESVLFPGDRLNACTGEVRNARGQLVEFDTRLKETEKANKAIADAEAKKKAEAKKREQARKKLAARSKNAKQAKKSKK